jgi:hypothetical protein
MLLINFSKYRYRNEGEKAMVLIGVLTVLSLIALMATVAVTSTFTEINISSNYKNSKQAFYIAEAGLQHAKAILKTIPFNDVLDGTYSGEPGILFKDGREFGNGLYTIEIKDNDDGDGNPVDDSDNIVNIISTGALSNGSRTSVELKIEKTLIPFPPIPAPITIIGEADTSISSSLNIVVDGRDWRFTDTYKTGPTGPDYYKYAIALSNIGSGVSMQTPFQAMASLARNIREFQAHNFIGKPTAYIDIESIGLDTEMKSKDLLDFINLAKLVADGKIINSDLPKSGVIVGNTRGPNNNLVIGSKNIDLGSIIDPKITYFDLSNNGSQNPVEFIGEINGSGLLIIEGTDLIFSQQLFWTGIIVVAGKDIGCGLYGGGVVSQIITGALIVDEQDEDHPAYKELVLIGNVYIRYSSEAVEMAQNLVFKKGVGNIKMLTWRQRQL